MLCNIKAGLSMSVGPSGRIVIEIDPETKQELYQALAKENLTLKHWFLNQAEEFLKDRQQLKLELVTNSQASGEN